MKRILITLLTLNGALLSQELFDAPRFVETNSDRIRISYDLDRDGDIDLLTFGGDILLNDGSGHFTPGSNLGFSAASVQQIIDIDQDGFCDLVFGVSPSFGLPSVSVRHGQPGMTWGPPQTLWTGAFNGYATYTQARDLDSDGLIDILIFNYIPSANVTRARWLRALPGGGYVTSPHRTLTGRVQGVEFTDWDGDSFADLAVFLYDAFDILEIHPTFSPTIRASTPVPGGGFFGDLTVGDFDGDADDDACLVGSGVDSDTFFFLENISGTYTFHPQQTLPLFPSSESEPAAIDWDEDGDLDIVVGSDTTFILENDGNAQFTVTQTRPGDLRVGVGDLNGDGHQDLVGWYSIAFGIGAIEPDASFTASDTQRGFADLDGDGDMDIINSLLEVQVNDGSGHFTTTLITIPPTGVPNEYWNGGALVGDFDGDGQFECLIPRKLYLDPFLINFVVLRYDLLQLDTNLQLTEVGPATSPSVTLPITTGHFPLVVDIDGDGDMDLVDDGVIAVNDGSNFFTPQSTLPAGMSPTDAADVDADGDIDLVGMPTVLPAPLDAIDVLRQQAGSFTTETLTLPSGEQRKSRPIFADCDDDGDLDILVGTRNGLLRSIVIFENVGGNFAPTAPIPVTTNGDGMSLAVADIDGDGTADIVVDLAVLREKTGILFGTQTPLQFSDPMVYLADSTSSGVSAQVELLDVDGDGDLDVIGRRILRARTPLTTGGGRQYGQGSPGTGNLRPILGFTGPLTPASTTASLVISQAIGGTAGILVSAPLPAAFTDTPFPGMTGYLDGPLTVVPISLGGVYPAFGEGSLSFGFSVPASLSGSSLYLQAALLDPGATYYLTVTNGLEIVFGF
ncbi:MAG TPA: VCBS repeat-containing protein [Planctomycetes bacterium]|nr:VCBS repeat-containing protein [Planctomycetota bacterium]